MTNTETLAPPSRAELLASVLRKFHAKAERLKQDATDLERGLAGLLAAADKGAKAND